MVIHAYITSILVEKGSLEEVGVLKLAPTLSYN